jgi:hypothetical protein
MVVLLAHLHKSVSIRGSSLRLFVAILYLALSLRLCGFA